MWTAENRQRYNRDKLRYPSDLTNEEWGLIEPFIPPAKRGGNRRIVDIRAVVNGLMYQLSTGCQWRYIPDSFPHHSTVYRYFQYWNQRGVLDKIHDVLYGKCREKAERNPSPTGSVIDSQSVKSAEKGGSKLIRTASMRARKSRAKSVICSSIR